jgi:hypothetical protein
VNRPKAIGTKAETTVARFLAANGFPHAERRALRGTLDAGDITGTPGLCWEVKGGNAARSASDGLVETWLAETEAERLNANADLGVLVLQRAGVGPANAGRWWAVMRLLDAGGVVGWPAWLARPVPVRMHLADAVQLLRTAGYGNALEGEVA